MSSKSPGNSTVPSNPDYSSLPRGILGRRGVPVARGARLPSVRVPRDLTLGGAAQKRTFTPNIPVRKEKKDEENKVRNEVIRKDGRKNPRQRGGARGGARGGRGGARGNDNLIQLQGAVFGEGPMAMDNKKKFGGGARYESEGSGSSYIQAPKYRASTSRTKEEREDEEKMLENLYKDDFIDDLDDKKGKVAPIQLPLLSFEVKKEVLPNKNIVKIKEEPRDEDDVMETNRMSLPESVVIKMEVPDATTSLSEETCQKMLKEMSLNEILSSRHLQETGNLFLFQFPDSLPGALAQTDDQETARPPKNTPSTSKEKEEVNANESPSSSLEESKCSLSDLPEGYIGKLKILKSGKCELIFGSVSLKVELGTNLGFLQQLVSVHEKEEELVVLGNISRNIVCHPDMEKLLIKSNKEPT